MSTHYVERCQFGVVHGQCRCSSSVKSTKRILCTTPVQHGTSVVSDTWEYGNCYICNDSLGFGGHNGRQCPTGILRREADEIREGRNIPKPKLCCEPWAPCSEECEQEYADQGYQK